MSIDNGDEVTEVERTGSADVEFLQIKIAKLLSTYNLEIPQVQREYCWNGKIVDGLLRDLESWKRRRKCDREYHLGCVILKEQDDNTYEIFDGQQRLTTFALLLYLDNMEDIHLLKSEKTLYSSASRKNIIEVYKKLIEKSSGTDLRDWAKGEVVVSVVKIGKNAPRDLPFRFFNHVNSSGVRLTDYDLLKSHHLRFVDDDIAEDAAKRWHSLEAPESLQDEKPPLTKRLLHQTLYRLRKWSTGEEFRVDDDENEERRLFNHFRATVDTPKEIMALPRPMQFDSIVSGGVIFFDFVSRQQRAFEAFSTERAIKLLDKYLSKHSRGVLWSGIRALCFLYYLRFGPVYLGQAVKDIAKYVSQIRNKKDVRGTYLSSQPQFRTVCNLLRRATDEGQFLATLNMVAEHYDEVKDSPTKESYWNDLSALNEEIKNV